MILLSSAYDTYQKKFKKCLLESGLNYMYFYLYWDLDLLKIHILYTEGI